MISITYTSFRTAVSQLQQGIGQAEKQPEAEIIRDGVIQRFEYCYELANKTIKRVLEVEFNENVDTMPFKDILRTAVEHHLITDAIAWARYRDERNKSSHTYDAVIAAEVYKAAKDFLPEAQYLLQQLDRLNA